MQIAFSLVLIVAAVAMVMVGRPRDGESRPFFKVWIVGQIYVLISLISAVMGVALLIAS